MNKNRPFWNLIQTNDTYIFAANPCKQDLQNLKLKSRCFYRKFFYLCSCRDDLKIRIYVISYVGLELFTKTVILIIC